MRAGELLFDVGDQNTRFFVVLSGAIDVVRPIGDREEPLIVHGASEFTGEINMLSARRSLVRARASVDGAVIAVDRDDLRTLVQRDSELSEILMRAFILRRVALMEQETNDLVLLGSRHSGSTQRIREFLSRNGQPFTYQDVETDPGGAGAARPLSRRRRRGAGDRLPRRPRPQEPVHRDAGLRRSA